jgi:hypothetical protein
LEVEKAGDFGSYAFDRASPARLESMGVPISYIQYVFESVLYVMRVLGVEGATMAHPLTTKDRYLVQDRDRGTGSLHGDVGNLDHQRRLSARLRKKGGNEQQGAQTTPVVVIEQWVCFVLGFVCMAFGFWGICMKPGQGAFSAYVAWLGSLYMPTLRVTAVVCLGLGAMLVRRGWAQP